MGVEDELRTPRRGRRRLVAAVSWLIAIGLAVGWAVYLRPASLGGPAGYVIVSGTSMEPMMQTGDLAIVRRQADYRVGDVVAYRIPAKDVGGGMLVIHRVIGGHADEGLVLQGDNRDTKDMWRPTTGDVVGTLQWHIPHAGTAMFLLRTPLVLAAVLGFFGFWFVVTSERKPDEDRPEAMPINDLESTGAVEATAGENRSASRYQSPPNLTGTAATVAVVAISVVAFLLRERRQQG